MKITNSDGREKHELEVALEDSVGQLKVGGVFPESSTEC